MSKSIDKIGAKVCCARIAMFRYVMLFVMCLYLWFVTACIFCRVFVLPTCSIYKVVMKMELLLLLLLLSSFGRQHLYTARKVPKLHHTNYCIMFLLQQTN
jgi:hypothetical protein